MATKFTPLHDRILVRRIEEGETTRGGIIIPDSAKEKPQEGEVVSVGKGRTATASCSANTPAPKSSWTTKTSSSCAKRKCSES